jgi:hypothetical protein
VTGRGWNPPALLPCATTSGGDDRTNAQEPARLYSTRLRALRAMRYAVEQDCCRRLAAVYVMIEKELGK